MSACTHLKRRFFGGVSGVVMDWLRERERWARLTSFRYALGGEGVAAIRSAFHPSAVQPGFSRSYRRRQPAAVQGRPAGAVAAETSPGSRRRFLSYQRAPVLEIANRCNATRGTRRSHGFPRPAG